MKTVKFYYITPNCTLFSKDEQSLDHFYLKELQKRDVNIIFEKELSKVSFDHFLHFKNDFSLEFNYCHVVPQSITPSFLKYSEFCGFTRKNEFIFDQTIDRQEEPKETIELKQKSNNLNKTERPSY